MRSSSSLVLLLATLGGGLAACSDPATNVGPVDAGSAVDTGVSTDRGSAMDTGTTTTDGGRADTGTAVDRPAVDAGPPYDPCSAASVIDLNAMGTTAGNVTRITRNNNAVGAMAPLRGPCGSPGHEVAFRYVPRTTARLRISTNNMGTDMMLDTVVWAQATCAPSTGDGGVSALGCNDDNGSPPRTRGSAFSTMAPATMGTPIFIVVAGYTPSAGMGFVAQGNFELSVTEIATVAAGGMCDPTGATNVCAMGSNCVAATGAATGTCTADGALNGACRATGAACDGALVCSGSATSTSSRCRTAVAAGAACDPLRVMNVCATGTNCVTRGGASTCVAAGSQGGGCRTTEPRCDGALSCSPLSVCRAIVAADGACETSNATTVCAAGGTCVAATPGAAMGTCRGAGTAAGTACRDAAPRCDTGLECSAAMGAGVCRRTVASGGACAPASNAELCAMGTACRPTSATAGTCAAGTAETEPNNTPMAAQAPITTSTVFSGMATNMDADCFGVTVPMGGSLFVESNLPATPTCPSTGPDPVINVFDPAGMEITEVDDGRGLCANESGTDNADLRSLAAGRYTVCIRAFNAMAVNYLLTVGVYPTP